MSKSRFKSYALSEGINSVLQAEYKNSRRSATQVGQAITSLSRYFQQADFQQTPWDKPLEQLAYTLYFTPLNYLRNKAVIDRCASLGFFKDINHIFDFGSGAGTSHFAFSETLNLPYSCYEISEEAKRGHTYLSRELKLKPPQFLKNEKQIFDKAKVKGSLAVLSYSLNELENLPSWIFDFEKILIIEPSTQEVARKLMNYRTDFLEKGFHIVAPCTHAQACPLLVESKKDWCHDRIHIEMPPWWKAIEDKLPMTNNTLTFSYLAVQKQALPLDESKTLLRVIGDTKVEKGKTRQLVCRGPQREFLTWLKKHKIKQDKIPRGQKLQIDLDQIEKKSDELRVLSEDSIQSWD